MPWGQAMLGANRLPLQPEAGQSASACLGWIIKSWLSNKAVIAAQVELSRCSRAHLHRSQHLVNLQGPVCYTWRACLQCCIGAASYMPPDGGCPVF